MKTVFFAALLCLSIVGPAPLARAQTLRVSASPANITNEGEESIFTLAISPAPLRNIAVNFVMTGNAGLDSDYVLIGDFNNSGQVVIFAGHTTSTITLHAFSDDDPKSKETAVFNLLGGKGYKVGLPSRAQVTIQNIP